MLNKQERKRSIDAVIFNFHDMHYLYDLLVQDQQLLRDQDESQLLHLTKFDIKLMT